MAGNITQKLGTAAQALTISLASLTTTSARESTAVDNSSDLFQDVLVQVKVKAGGSSTSSSGVVNVYAYGTVDPAGPTWPDNVTGSDAALTMVSPPNLKLIGQLNVVANSTTYKSEPFSVAAAFGGMMPTKWGIVIENQSGGTLDATAGNHAALYQGLYSQYT